MRQKNTLFFVIFFCLVVAVCLFNVNCGATRPLSINEYKKDLLINPYNTKIRYRLAVKYYKAEKYTHALGELRRVTDYDPDNSRAHALMGLTLAKVGQDEIAEIKVEQSLMNSWKPDVFKKELADFLMVRGIEHAVSGDATRAIRCLRNSLDIKKTYKARQELAKVYCQVARNLPKAKENVALDYYKKALELDKNLEIAQQGISSITTYLPEE